MANKERGELDVDLGGELVTLRLDFSALQAIENKLEKGIAAIVDRFAKAEFALQEMAVLIQQALKAASGVERRLEDIGEAIMKDGISHHLETCVQLLSTVVKGHFFPEKKPFLPDSDVPTGSS